MNQLSSSLSILLGLCVGFASCRREQAAEPTALPAPFRIELLQTAASAATAFPLDPHIKTRSRLQQQVVEACLEIGAVDLAVETADEIANWRRGLALAALAEHVGRSGDRALADERLGAALAEAEKVSLDPDEQEWRRDAILARVAEAWLALGEVERAVEMRVGLDLDQARRLDAALTDRLDAAQARAQLAVVDAAIESQNLADVHTALLACVRIFDALYDDAELRAACAERVENGYPKLPIILRLELLTQLVEAALAHEDVATARTLALEVQRRGDGVQWAAEQHAPHLARTGRLLALCGEAESARREIKAAESVFEDGQERIFDIDRCDALLPIFEAWRALGDMERAEAALARAIAAAGVNPNARPRAEDLVATLTLLARLGHEPSAPVHRALIDLREGLVDPW
jgi:hypothetical protein